MICDNRGVPLHDIRHNLNIAIHHRRPVFVSQVTVLLDILYIDAITNMQEESCLCEPFYRPYVFHNRQANGRHGHKLDILRGFPSLDRYRVNTRHRKFHKCVCTYFCRVSNRYDKNVEESLNTPNTMPMFFIFDFHMIQI